MKKTQKHITYILFLLAPMFFAGCSILSVDQTIQTSPTPAGSQIIISTPIAEQTAQVIKEQTQSVFMDSLILWVPAEFNPADTSSGSLLQQQIDTFTQDHPGVQIDVRVKDVTGPASLLTSLELTLNNAPKVAPSLVLISRNDLETAAISNLVQSSPSYQTIMEDEDWYDYGRQLALVQNNYYGIPFAADAMIMATRTYKLNSIADSWGELLTANNPLFFPAADSRALFTINLYLSSEGSLYDEQNNLHLDAEKLTKVFEFYETAIEDGGILPGVMDYSSDEQIWTAFEEKKINEVVCWISDYFSETSVYVAGLIIPPLENEPVTMISGWVWAISDPFEERMELDMELLQYLTAADFQAEWTSSAGYLPVRSSGLTEWENPAHVSLISQATISAVNQPSNEVLTLIGPILNEAVTDVIVNHVKPSEAALTATQKINGE